MLRKVAARVAWVGRTASMVFGLALVLALVFGALSVAVAHTGSAGLFHLNHSNTANAVSKLVGSTAGTLLKLDQNGAGTALNLEVNLDKPPLVTSPGSGTATNFSADRLDRYDESAFFNANHFNASTYLVNNEHTIPSGHGVGVSTGCDVGDIAVGAGPSTATTHTLNFRGGPDHAHNGWKYWADNNGSFTETLTVSVRCLDFAPRRNE